MPQCDQPLVPVYEHPQKRLFDNTSLVHCVRNTGRTALAVWYGGALDPYTILAMNPSARGIALLRATTWAPVGWGPSGKTSAPATIDINTAVTTRFHRASPVSVRTSPYQANIGTTASMPGQPLSDSAGCAFRVGRAAIFTTGKPLRTTRLGRRNSRPALAWWESGRVASPALRWRPGWHPPTR